MPCSQVFAETGKPGAIVQLNLGVSSDENGSIHYLLAGSTQDWRQQGLRQKHSNREINQQQRATGV